MCVEDVAVREDVLYFYVGSGAELLAEAESQVDVCAETYFPVVILKEIVWIEVYVGVILETSVAVECIVHGKSHADGLLIEMEPVTSALVRTIFSLILLTMRSCWRW